MKEVGQNESLKCIKDYGINHLVVIGGEGSFKGTQKLHQLGINVIGIPGND